MGRRYSVPPTQQLQLPWKAWGEVDQVLTEALELYETRICSCGCGQWAAECHNPANKGRYRVDDTTCHARAAIEDWHKANPKASPSTLLTVQILPEGTSPEDNIRAEMQAVRARHGITGPDPTG